MSAPSEGLDARERLQAAVTGEAAKAQLTLAWRRSAGDYRVELVELADGVAEQFLTQARSAAAQLLEGEQIGYDPEWPLKDHEYFKLAGSELPGGNLFTALQDFHNLDTFHRRNLTKPRLYVVAVQSDGATALLGRRMAHLQVLKQRAGLFAATWDGSTFNALQGSVATFSTAFDWILWEGELYVLDAGAFHAEFRDGAALKRAVAEHVQQLSARIEIRNADAMTKRCQASVPMASKLKRISESGLQLTATPAELKTYASTYAIDVAWEGEALVFDGSLENQWAIFKLLDEDRTEGPVSHRRYESAAKREV